ncbi:alpha/beta hydrolase fold domain-containing protein [Treponema parvum]|uniref:Alpha/beta hydrolase fold domain-containing protein n=1 Tax=Treponema parvum TaxID=138851 RepID=A0A975F272_9SPIR|nr:alpha/beta hydrolase fold domain-containing protein [Treponema parvum]QTQ13129.1 alpha/beta hydrolase fold domain-containing protein [Treponema parvum]QTQ15373.1 alpha/beta hydrolase fold domain-containing protein [Treponema parvum]
MFFSDNRKAAVKKLRNLVLNSKTEISVFRKKLEAAFQNPILPNRVTLSEHVYGNIKCDVLIPEIYSSRRIVLYIHGGCFAGGSCASWRNFCASIANTASSRVVVPEFRLAPAHAFPAAMEDIQLCFRSLYTEEQISLSLDAVPGERAEPEIIVAADGSGATLALAVLFTLKERYKKSVKQTILFSPWLDLSPSSQVFQEKRSCDEVISADCLRKSGEFYTYESNLQNPLVSPVYAEEEMLKGFPDVFIQMGEKEILLPDAIKFKNKLEENGINCTLDVWKDMMFMFQMADEYLSSPHLALEKIGKLITARKSCPEDFFADYSKSAAKSRAGGASKAGGDLPR